MPRSRFHSILGVAAAALSVSLLAGCSGISEIPSGVGSVVQSIIKDVTDPVTVEQARAARRAELVPAVSDEDLVTPGTLTVGVRSTGTAPLVMTGSDGSTMGIDVDTAYALADELGLAHVEFVSVTNVAAGLASCDVVMSVDATQGDCTVVGSYAQSALGVFAAGDTVATPIAATEFSGKTVGVQESSVSQASLAKLGLGNFEETFSNLNEAFDALATGSVDYVVCDAYAGAYLACMHEGISFAGTIDTPVPVGVAVSTDATSLQANVQAALDAIQTNGVADIAKSRWVGEFPALTEATVVTGLPEPQEEPVDEGDENSGNADAQNGDEGEDGVSGNGYSADDAGADGTDAGTDDSDGTYIGSAYAFD